MAASHAKRGIVKCILKEDEPGSIANCSPGASTLVQRYRLRQHLIHSRPSSPSSSFAARACVGYVVGSVMPSLIATAIQNTCLKAAANLTAQFAARWHAENPDPLDLQRILEFAVFGFIGANIGYTWHYLLEDYFPTRTLQAGKPTDGDEAKAAAVKLEGGGPMGQTQMRVSYKNLFIKILLDQTISLPIMLTIFLIVTNVARLPTMALVFDLVNRKLWGLVKAGWVLWPTVGLCNFLWVPVRSRVIVASCVGFGWNIFLSVMAMRHHQEHQAAGTIPVSGGDGGK